MLLGGGRVDQRRMARRLQTRIFLIAIAMCGRSGTTGASGTLVVTNECAVRAGADRTAAGHPYALAAGSD